MSTNYDLFDTAINDEDSISARYAGDPTGDPRKLLPYVLGYSEVPDSSPPVKEAMVLCYQYGGYTEEPLSTPHPHPRNWRCFKVDSFLSVAISTTSLGFPPIHMTGQHRKRQNCVQDIENFAHH